MQGFALIGVLLVAPLLALAMAFLTGAMLCVPLMIALHFAHVYIPLVPALGWQASFWLLVAVRLLLPGAGYGSSSKD